MDGVKPCLVDKIIAYENGDMNDDQIVEFFQELVDTGVIFNLQGSYQRAAASMLAGGLIHRKADV